MSRASRDGQPPLHVQVFQTILAVAQQLRYLMDRELAADGVTTQQAALLTVIQRSGGAPSLTQAATALATSYQNVMQLARILERKGLLQIVVDEQDARVRRLQTTARNARYWRQRDPGDFAQVADWFSQLSQTELRMLLQLLAKVRARSRARIDGDKGGDPAPGKPRGPRARSSSSGA